MPITTRLPQFLKIVILFLFLSSFAPNTFAQKKPGYTLLWEISGKGLSKPSYLFGSIHIRDARAFTFSDSVYKAIAASAVFVLEKHPDSSIHSFGPINANATAKDKASEMRTTANYYLYGVAKTLKKKIYGLESNILTTEQNDSGEDVVEAVDEEEEQAQKEELEKVLDMYQEGNLDELWRQVQYYYEGEDTAPRTKALYDEILKLIVKENAFITLGVAQLPGNDGLIALLKNAGYQLRPVEATFTDFGKSEHIDYAKMDWYKNQDEQHNYSVNFPSIPNIQETNNRVKIKTYTDPINGVVYTASSLYTGPLNKDYTSEKYADTALAQYLKSAKLDVLKRSVQSKFGTTVVEVELKGEKVFAKTLLFHANDTFYTFTVEHYTNIFNDAFTNLFFNSIEVLALKTISANNWIDYKNKPGSFSVKIPMQPEAMVQEIANEQLAEPYKMNIYMAADKANMINYIFRYNDYPSGMYLASKQEVINALLADFKKRGQQVGEIKAIEKEGYEGRELDLIDQNSYYEIQLFIRGNRTYLLIRQNMKGTTKPKPDQFFTSFKFDPYAFKNESKADIGNFSFTMPATPKQNEKVKKNDDETEEKYTSFLEDEKLYHTVNTNSGGLYGVGKSMVSKYLKHKNIDSLNLLIIGGLKPQSDTTAKAIDFKMGSVNGKEILAQDQEAGTFKKIRTWFNQGEFYYQYLIASKEEIESEGAKEFFSTVKVIGKAPQFDYASSKIKLIANDLLSTEQITRKKALGALSYYTLEQNELPVVYHALEQRYSDDTTSTGARTVLLNTLSTLNDAQTSAFLKKLYQNSKGLDLIQGEILALTPSIDKQSYDWYLKTLTEGPALKLKNYWSIFSPLSDSLSYTAAHLNQLLKLVDTKPYRPALLAVFSELLFSKDKIANQTLLNAKKTELGKYALIDLAQEVEELKQGNGSNLLNSYLNILPRIDLPQLTDPFTQKIIALDSVPYLRTTALAARIIANLPLNQSLLTAELDSLSSRYAIMSAFESIGKLNLVPLKYRKHDEFARLLISDYFAEEYDYPKEIKLLGTIKDEQGTYYAFECTYLEEGERKAYLGICGPFNSKSEQLNFKEYSSYSKFELKEKDWSKQAKALIAELKEAN